MGLAESSERRRRGGSKLVADINAEFISNCTLLSDAISLQDGPTPVFFLKATPNTHLQTLAIQLQPRRS
ncbi:hypothetical protein AB1N83_000844 [Pleurotus pulmonarius]